MYHRIKPIIAFFIVLSFRVRCGLSAGRFKLSSHLPAPPFCVHYSTPQILTQV
nr:MAG TPA: hypothetical protein [Caudoviricetes sp.]